MFIAVKTLLPQLIVMAVVILALTPGRSQIITTLPAAIQDKGLRP